MTKSRERGVVAVEFAIIVPIFLLLVQGVIEGGGRYFRETQFNNAALIAARSMSISPHNLVTARGDAANAAGISPAAAVTAVRFDQDALTCKTGVNVKATITFREPGPTGIFGSPTYVGVGVARCDG